MIQSVANRPHRLNAVHCVLLLANASWDSVTQKCSSAPCTYMVKLVFWTYVKVVFINSLFKWPQITDDCPDSFSLSVFLCG